MASDMPPDLTTMLERLARIEGKIDSSFQYMGAKQEEHDRAILSLAATQEQHGQSIASIQTVIEERSRTPVWMTVVPMLVSIGALLLSIMLVIKGNGVS